MSYSISLDRINSIIQDVNRQGNNVYWAIGNPGYTVNLADSVRDIMTYYRHEEGYERVVYWPDYKIYGKINSIVRILRNSGVNQVQVGSLYAMSNGQIGCPPQIVPLSEEVVTACSFDPLNETHRILLEQLLGFDLRYLLNQQQITQRRENRLLVGNELLMLPPYRSFPGGLSYQQAQQRNIGQYGMKL